MQNLEQKRAAHALTVAQQVGRGKEGGEVVKKVPAMIRENGLLGALAFAVETDEKGNPRNKGHRDVFEAIARYLQLETPEHMLEELAKADSAKLRAVTAESLAYLAYLRRFAGKQQKEATRL